VAATVGRRVGRAARHAGRALTRRRVPTVVAALAMTAVVGVLATGAFADDRPGLPRQSPGSWVSVDHLRARVAFRWPGATAGSPAVKGLGPGQARTIAA